MQKRVVLVIILIAIVLVFSLYLVHPLKNKDKRGSNIDPNIGAIKLDNCQEITRSGQYVLTNDILSGEYCFNISVDHVSINGQGYSIYGSKKIDGYGIEAENVKNLYIENINFLDYEKGIFLINTTNSTFFNNSLESNVNGIVLLDKSDNNNFSHNNIEKNGNYALSIFSSISNTFSNNELDENFEAITLDNDKNFFYDNHLLKNIHSISIFSRKVNTSINQESDFNLTMKSISGKDCVDCNFKIEISPLEVLKMHQDKNIVKGNFIPSRKGIYAIKIDITDIENNTETLKYVYLVSPTKEITAEYYLRGIDPTHDQALSWGSLHSDSGSLLSEKPTSEETRACADWIQFSPDELPTYLYGIIRDINISINYTSDSETIVGVQRFGSYNEKTDYSINKTNIPKSNNIQNFDFKVNWPTNYFWEWYWLTVKLSTNQGNPRVFIDPAKPTEAFVTYVYSSTPAIKSISNPNLLSLSATMPENKNEALVEIEGNGINRIVLEMPDKTKKYYGEFDGKSCDVINTCLLVHQNNGEMEFLLSLNGKHSLKIVPQE